MRHFLTLKSKALSQVLLMPMCYGLLLVSVVATSGCKFQFSPDDESVVKADGYGGGGYFSQVISHMVGHGTERLKQLAMDPESQAKVAAMACKQLPEAQQARCYAGLVNVGKVSQGVGTAFGAEITEAKNALKDTMEDPQALVSGIVQIGESAVSDPNYLGNQAAALRDDAVECGKTMIAAFKNRDYKTAAEGVTHIGLLLVPFGKAAKVAKVAEEANLAAHIAEVGARLKVTTDTIKGTGCTGTANPDGSLSTTLTVETPLLNPKRSSVEVY